MNILLFLFHFTDFLSGIHVSLFYVYPSLKVRRQKEVDQKPDIINYKTIAYHYISLGGIDIAFISYKIVIHHILI